MQKNIPNLKSLLNDIQITDTDPGFVFTKKLKVEHEYLNCQNLFNVYQVIKKNHLDPYLIDFELDNNHLQARFVYEPQVRNAYQLDFINQNCLLILAKIEKLHAASHSFIKIEKFLPKPFLARFLNDTTLEKALLKPYLSYANISLSRKWVLSHNDLNAGNILYNLTNKDIYLCDWDFAMLNDPLFDVASLISENDLNLSSLNQIFNSINPSSHQRLAQWINYQNLLWASWSYFLWQKTHNSQYQVIYQQKMLKLKINWELLVPWKGLAPILD